MAFGLPEELCQRIVNFRGRLSAFSLASYQQDLSQQDVSTIAEVFSNLSQPRLDAFWQFREDAVLRDQLGQTQSRRRSGLFGRCQEKIAQARKLKQQS